MHLHPVFQELIILIEHHRHLFDGAFNHVKSYHLDEFKNIKNLRDWLTWCDHLLRTPITEDECGENVTQKLAVFNFFFNQPELESLLESGSLSQWMRQYANSLREFYDSPESITPESLETFYQASAYRMEEYMENPSGWKTFNQFFARHVKPGYRPIADLCNDHIIVSVADSVFKGAWDINGGFIIVKDIEWSIEELLDGHPGAEYFRDGIFMHAFLTPTDYHRLHTPVAGRVLYTKVVPGDVYLETYVEENRLKTCRARGIGMRDGVGYQFSQARGIIILETMFGKVAIIPVGMGFVSSVAITAEKDVILRKGEEIAYFQFGASDYIMLFPDEASVFLTANLEQHYNQGEKIGYFN